MSRLPNHQPHISFQQNPIEIYQTAPETTCGKHHIEEQARFKEKCSTTKQIVNLHVIFENYRHHQQDLYHVFEDFKKAFDWVWHNALWTTMKLYNINANLSTLIQNLYNNTSINCCLYEQRDWRIVSYYGWNKTAMSLISYNLQYISREDRDGCTDRLCEGTVSVSMNATNLRLADDIL